MGNNQQAKQKENDGWQKKYEILHKDYSAIKDELEATNIIRKKLHEDKSKLIDEKQILEHDNNLLRENNESILTEKLSLEEVIKELRQNLDELQNEKILMEAQKEQEKTTILQRIMDVIVAEQTAKETLPENEETPQTQCRNI